MTSATKKNRTCYWVPLVRRMKSATLACSPTQRWLMDVDHMAGLIIMLLDIALQP